MKPAFYNAAAILHPEISKLAEEQMPLAMRMPELAAMEPPNIPDEDRVITKDRLKRGLIVAGQAAAGSGLGYGAGSAINRLLYNKPNTIGEKLLKYGPAVSGLITGLTIALMREKNRIANNYIAYGEKPDTKQELKNIGTNIITRGVGRG